MIKQFPLYLSLAIAIASPITSADIEVQFIESAPKDRFVLTNTGKCVLQDLTVDIDLTNSSGRLIFDTTSAGAGVEVYQPFSITYGPITLLSSDRVLDGDTKLSLGISTIEPGEAGSFTIDVDDTLKVSELGKIRVSGSEIQHGLVIITTKDNSLYNAAFSNKSRALVELPPCPET